MKNEPQSHKKIRSTLQSKGYTARSIRYERPNYGNDLDSGGWWVAIDPLPIKGQSPIVCFSLPEVLKEIAALPNYDV
jgi:hypothetical protein